MDGQLNLTLRRFVVCIDGSDLRDSNKQSNRSNIERIHRLVHSGQTTSPEGQQILQTKQYYTTSRLKVVELVRDIVRDICQTLITPQDELYIFGSGNGAFVARAVAGMMHHMGLPREESMPKFDEIFDSARDLIKARFEDDHRTGPKLAQMLKELTMEPPKIPYVGLFDTLKLTSKFLDVAFVPSVKTVRHALALNESKRAPLLFHNLYPPEGRSLIEAWFIGSNDDICGGVKHDGLSIYPLQWILLEAIDAGITLSPVKSQPAPDENPLSLAFPQFAGSVPSRHRSEEIEWRTKYANGLQISMFDLSIIHSSGKKPTGEDHAIKLSPGQYNRVLKRPVFSDGKLNGYNVKDAYGTVLHPSFLCILDMVPRYMELGSFRGIQKGIANFQEKCVDLGDATLPPWLENMELQASGVKAFRILVCGKTGVGKSTLINKVFGVEMTEESLSYNQGVHDINKAFESPKHPGLLVHDSRGWQAGSDAELDLIAQFLRHRAFQNDPAEALHVIWFCVDSDVSRIEEADKRTFETIAQFSNQVPVFVVGTKKDKVVSSRQMALLEKHMEEMNDYKKAKELARAEASAAADEQFSNLRTQLSQIEHYRADGYCCISKDDTEGVKDLLAQTLELIVDDRVRIFCVAAQVVDVEQKINAAITESMRLGTHAVRTAAVPLPFSGLIGTPTVSRIIVEHVLQCFGFPKTTPAEVEQVLKNIVSKHRKDYLKIGLTQTAGVGLVTIGAAIPTMGIGAVAGLAGCLLAVPPAARMLLKCACDMILILERSFRYDGKYVSVKQIEDAAKYYTSAQVKTFSGNEKGLQQLVHDEIERMIPLSNVKIGLNFKKLRSGVEDIIYGCRFDHVTPAQNEDTASLRSRSQNLSVSELVGSLPPPNSTSPLHPPSELDASEAAPSELQGSPPSTELYGSERSWPRTNMSWSPTLTAPSISEVTTVDDRDARTNSVATDKGFYEPHWGPKEPVLAELDASNTVSSKLQPPSRLTELDNGSTTTVDRAKSEGKSKLWKPSSWKLGKKTKSTSNK